MKLKAFAVKKVKDKKKAKTPMTAGNMVLKAVKLALDKKALEPVIYDVRKLTTVTDFFLICHGASDRNVKAIADNIVEEFKKLGYYAVSAEGYALCQWIVIDYSDIVIHIFQKDTRDYYNLEGIWGDAKTIDVPA